LAGFFFFTSAVSASISAPPQVASAPSKITPPTAPTPRGFCPPGFCRP
jgi:hypothetical protein